MERSRNKIRSPRMKASNVQYAPEGRRGNVYVDEDGRRIYRTSGKSGNSKRYVVMDDGELKRGERQELSKIQNVVYQDETDYETVSEADSEYLVPVRPKGERNSTRRIVQGRPPVITRTISEERPRTLTRTISEERPRVVTRRIIEEDIPRDSNVVLRSRPASGHVVRRDYDNTREAYVVRSSRPASAIVRSRPSSEIIRERPASEIIRERPSSERIITKRIIEDDALNTREVYVRRERPSSEIIRERPSSSRIVARRIEDDRREVYVRKERPSSEKRIVENREVVHIRRPRSEERVLRRQEYIDYPQEYMVRRPVTRDVGCQMTTNYVIQQPPKQRKLLRNVQTQTIKKQKERKIKTATHYYQRETVEVVQEPPTPRMPTPPPPPRIPTPEPPKRKSKKRKPKKVLL